MDQASRKSMYQVVGIGRDGYINSIKTQYSSEAQKFFKQFKNLGGYKTVLFCTSTPTMTKGQIDPDLY